jgi:very-long-chain (3R)-3-hydroxyacyl-CoA dehydratase
MAEVKKSKGLSLANVYLVLYNIILAIGWLIILLVTNQTINSWRSHEDLWTSKNVYLNAEFFLHIFQTAALLEVAHVLVGLVRSNPVLTFLQVLSRLLVVWLVMFVFEEVRNYVQER